MVDTTKESVDIRLIDPFCAIDDFGQEFEPRWNQMLVTNAVKQRQRVSSLSLSEVRTISVVHHSGYRAFKDFCPDSKAQSNHLWMVKIRLYGL